MTILTSDNIITETAATTPTPVAEKRGWAAGLWAELKGMFWLLLAVLGFHSFIAKPFYIPSISMMPTLLVGDRLFVSKYPYGWSHVSPTIPNPVAIFKWLVLRQEVEALAVPLPESDKRVMGELPKRGDIVILTPEGRYQDWIKRVIGLPGETISLRDGQVFLNGRPVKQEVQPNLTLIQDEQKCDGPYGPESCFTAFDGPNDRYKFQTRDGKTAFALPIVRETLPNGVAYDTIDSEQSEGDNFGPTKIPAGHVFLMGDNRDHSSDSRYSSGLNGPVRWDRLGGRAEIITFSVDGSTSLNPVSWITSLRGDRAGTSLRPAQVKGN